jgi:hypothetical protein
LTIVVRASQGAPSRAVWTRTTGDPVTRQAIGSKL